MRVIEPHQLRTLKKEKPKRTLWRILALSLVAFVVSSITLGAWLSSRPLPKVSPKVVTVGSKGNAVSLPWPNYGQSAIGAEGYGLLAASQSNQKPAPMASVAKVMTALAVVKVKPISQGQGPVVTLGETDVELYHQYVARGGSVAAVSNGERITERQALEALLLPSANNIADSLAIWAFGSLKNYTVYANKFASELGLKSTNITSASGYDVNTTSTAVDLVQLGLLAMKNPVISSIVAQKTANIPVAGNVKNYNFMLGRGGIVGIKTGNTDEAGGCYLFAAKRKLTNGQNTTVIGAIMGATNLETAQSDSLGLLDSSYTGFTERRLVSKGDILAYYDLPWGGQSVAVAAADLKVVAWNGANLKAKIYANSMEAGTATGIKVGTVQNGNNSVNIVLASSISLPSSRWRLTH